MEFKGAILLFVCLFVLPAISFAQNNKVNHKVNIEIPEVALLGLVSDEGINLNLNAISPTEAGSPITKTKSQTNNIWINYSSIITEKNHNRKIVAMVQGEIPNGIKIKVKASEATGNGNGRTGQSSGLVTLSNEPSEVIVGIGSCYTGKGSNNGHYLTYELEVDETQYSHLSEITEPLSVIYTLTDQN